VYFPPTISLMTSGSPIRRMSSPRPADPASPRPADAIGCKAYSDSLRPEPPASPFLGQIQERIFCLLTSPPSSYLCELCWRFPSPFRVQSVSAWNFLVLEKNVEKLSFGPHRLACTSKAKKIFLPPFSTFIRPKTVQLSSSHLSPSVQSGGISPSLLSAFCGLSVRLFSSPLRILRVFVVKALSLQKNVEKLSFHPRILAFSRESDDFFPPHFSTFPTSKTVQLSSPDLCQSAPSMGHFSSLLRALSGLCVRLSSFPSLCFCELRGSLSSFDNFRVEKAKIPHLAVNI